MMVEIYKTIEDYSNYEVSNLGNVRNKKTGKVLKYIESKDGYLQVDLYNDGKKKIFKVHRLVASAFLENPDNKPQVNHINGCKSNNCVDNLEWVTQSENMKHSYRIGLNKQTDKNRFKTNNPNPKKRVRCIETGQEFESITDTAIYFGWDCRNISNSIRKGCRCKGYHFEKV